ncbi:MAG: Spy/CpxP family protein refolding chaperone [Roseiarcus sp.]|jgi:Spy/CpxP family protein refolding chaperone
MKKLILGSVAAAALAGSVFALGAAAAPGDAPPPPEQMRHGMEMRGFMLDARLAGMKAALKLTPEQEKNWAPFETAVRDAEKERQDAMRQMRETMRGDERPSPIEHMNIMADRLAKASADVKAVASAAKPLYDSLDDTQKSHFGPLLMTVAERGPHEGPMMGRWGMGHWEMGRWGHRGPDDEPK